MTFRPGNRCYPSMLKELKHSLSSVSKHPKGTRARVLFSSVFGPYAQDDEFGSRKINPMELYHNQVTREQGPFSLRMFHRSWGIRARPAFPHGSQSVSDPQPGTRNRDWQSAGRAPNHRAVPGVERPHCCPSSQNPENAEAPRPQWPGPA